MNTRSQKGFTLVEIMIVVVIIGLLAAMAIPAFQQVRKSSIEKTVLNDARQIGSAAQQYMMEYGVSTFNFTCNANGIVDAKCVLLPWVKQVSKGLTTGGNYGSGLEFTLKKAGAFGDAAQKFNDEGKKVE